DLVAVDAVAEARAAQAGGRTDEVGRADDSARDVRAGRRSVAGDQGIVEKRSDAGDEEAASGGGAGARPTGSAGAGGAAIGGIVRHGDVGEVEGGARGGDSAALAVAAGAARAVRGAGLVARSPLAALGRIVEQGRVYEQNVAAIGLQPGRLSEAAAATVAAA